MSFSIGWLLRPQWQSVNPPLPVIINLKWVWTVNFPVRQVTTVREVVLNALPVRKENISQIPNLFLVKNVSQVISLLK